MKLIDGLPTVHIGRPDEDRHGLRTYPMLVTRPDGSWLAIGHARKHRRWPLPEVDFRPAVSVEIRMAVERTVAVLVGEADRLADSERADADRLTALDFDAQRLDAEEERIRQERHVIDTTRQAIHDRVASRWS
jgi:hypothetical protein